MNLQTLDSDIVVLKRTDYESLLECCTTALKLQEQILDRLGAQEPGTLVELHPYMERRIRSARRPSVREKIGAAFQGPK